MAGYLLLLGMSSGHPEFSNGNIVYMKTHQLIFHLKDADKFHNIRRGLKTVETRAYSPSYAEIYEGDVLEISCGKDSIIKKVSSVAKYKSITELFKEIDYRKVSPEVSNEQDAISVYDSFPGYSERIAKDGILAFTLSE